MKRSLSDSDSESLFDDDGLNSSSPSQSCQVSDRKKRRGVIEKRRRDRINNSLSELRRLVPSAFEKQGSAKLEKAEILQMTVDHLKMLHQKGPNGYNYHEQHTFSVDYRGVGYRECAAEVARYLVAVEGMDLQDPLRMRLLSHLQCFSAQREVVAKATTLQNNAWNGMTTHSPINNQYGSSTGMTSMGSMLTSQQHNQSDMGMNSHSTQGLSSTTYSDSRVSQPEISSTHLHSNMRLASSMNIPPLHGQMSNMNSSVSQQVSPSLIPQLHGQFPPMSLNSMQSIMSQNQSGQNYNNNSSSVKPYRPWGMKLWDERGIRPECL